MLKDQSSAKDGSLTLCWRAMTIAVLAAVGLVALGLRSPSNVTGAEIPSATEAKGVASATPSRATAFDLAYIPTKSMGFAAVRPAAIFERSDMKASLDALNAAIAKTIPIAMPRVESIEQATLGLYVYPRDKKAGRQGRFMIGGGMVRSVHDFDWKSLVRASLKLFAEPNSGLVEVNFEGIKYYKVTNVPAFYRNACFLFPDGRTVVNLDEEEIGRLTTRKAGDRPEFVSGADWLQVERGLIAVAIDNHDQRWKLDAATAEPDDLLVAPLIQNASRWVCGVDGADRLIIHAIATCGTDNQGQSLARTVEALLAMMREAANNTKIDGSKGKEEELAARGIRLFKEVLDGCNLGREGSAVKLSSECHSALDYLVKLILADAGM